MWWLFKEIQFWHLSSTSQFVNGGSLDQLIKAGDRRVLTWPTKISLALDTLSGLAYLHGKGRSNAWSCHLDHLNFASLFSRLVVIQCAVCAHIEYHKALKLIISIYLPLDIDNILALVATITELRCLFSCFRIWQQWQSSVDQSFVDQSLLQLIGGYFTGKT